MKQKTIKKKKKKRKMKKIIIIVLTQGKVGKIHPLEKRKEIRQ